MQGPSEGAHTVHRGISASRGLVKKKTKKTPKNKRDQKIQQVLIANCTVGSLPFSLV